MTTDDVIRFYQEFSLLSVRMPEIYSDDAFNEVRGPGAIQRVFAHMYTHVEGPRFL